MKRFISLLLPALIVAGVQNTRSQPAAADKPRLLIVGGGSHHDFDRWFNQEDTAILNGTGKLEASYTDKPDRVLPELKRLDVLYLSNNQPLTNPALRQGIFEFADSGKGLLLVHAALWYNWKDWPEYNERLVGGGTARHDRFGEFEVTVTDPTHPIMKGVPSKFMITDELYHFLHDEKDPMIHVLATATSRETGRTYPSIWTVKHPRARIACITLGHDGQAHQHPVFKTLLQNSALWTAGK